MSSGATPLFTPEAACGNCRQPFCDHGALTGACPTSDAVLLDETTMFRPATEAEKALWDAPSRR